jgi:hypothetical protein
VRTHEHDQATESASLRPKGARLDEQPAERLVRAAATGRSDVLDAPAILGLQRLAGNAAMGSTLEEERSPVHQVIGSGGGSALAPDVRAEMEGRLGHDFSDVRVHNDGAAHESAKSVNAHAYTVGSNVVFQRDLYDPSSTAGKTMLAHELTHVVQQREGAVDGTATAGGISVSDPSDRFERAASANAERVMAAPAPLAATAGTAVTAGTVQRDAEDHDHEHVQGMFVQREGEAPEEEKPEEDAPVQGMFVQREEEEEMEE